MLKFAIILAALCYGGESASVHVYRNVLDSTELVFGDPINWVTDELIDITINTTVLIHGHGGSKDDDFNSQVRREIFLLQDSYNVIVIDWAEEAKLNYETSFRYVETVAQLLRRFLEEFEKLTVTPATEAPTTTPELAARDTVAPEPIPADLRTVHLIGFNLGAHVAGIAGRRLSQRVARITGLDPAGSRWDNNPDRLSRNDANYVEVIHTDGSGLLANGIGTESGHVDFYANGGNNQPGCFSHSCSHNRAYELFAASIRNQLYGNLCTSSTQINLNTCRGRQLRMGDLNIRKSESGRFRVNTGRRWPYLP